MHAVMVMYIPCCGKLIACESLFSKETVVSHWWRGEVQTFGNKPVDMSQIFTVRR